MAAAVALDVSPANRGTGAGPGAQQHPRHQRVELVWLGAITQSHAGVALRSEGSFHYWRHRTCRGDTRRQLRPGMHPKEAVLLTVAEAAGWRAVRVAQAQHTVQEGPGLQHMNGLFARAEPVQTGAAARL
jgi:hypothetical protein